MKITEMAEVAEVVAAVGVLISLLYVGYEINQNTVAVRSTAYQAIHDAEDQFWADLGGDPVAVQLWQAGLRGGLANLDTPERDRFVVIARRLIYLYQNVHYQNRKGVVEEDLWQAWAVSLDEFIAEPGFSEVLDDVRPHLSDEFKGLVDQRTAMRPR